MIELTRLNRQKLILNAELIKWIEASPDTVITLINGEKMIVLESAEEIIQRVMEYRRGLLRGLDAGAVMRSGALAATPDPGALREAGEGDEKSG